jgi:hypothetical protein
MWLRARLRKVRRLIRICRCDAITAFSAPVFSVSPIATRMDSWHAFLCTVDASRRCSSLSELLLDLRLVLECPMPSSISYMRALDSSFCPFFRSLFSAFCDSFPILTPLLPNMPVKPSFCVNSLSRSSSESSISWSPANSSPDGLPS